MKLSTIKRRYNRNEGLNYHSENLLLLAKAFGTEEEIQEAERQAASRRDIDARVYDMPRHVAEKINSYYHKYLK